MHGCQKHGVCPCGWTNAESVVSACAMQERLADAQNAQTAADAEAKAADIKTKHLSKQAADQRKNLASKDKEASGMRKQLGDAQRKVDSCNQKLQVSA